jgi:hypothetical protein
MSGDSFGTEIQSSAIEIASTNGSGDHAEAASESIDPSAMAEAASTEATPTEAESPTAEVATDGSPDFLGRLAEAMQATADAERARASEEIDRLRGDHLAAIQERRESEAARMRELATEDRAAIETWTKAERHRIQVEHDRRVGELEADLALSLEEHRREVDGQVERVEAAVAAHRSSVEAFFASLVAETDPVRIAQLAGERPAFPDLEAAAGAPSASSDGAPAEDAMIGAAASSDAAGPGDAPGETTSAAAEPPVGGAVSPTSDDVRGRAAEDAAGAEHGVPVMDPIARLGLLQGGREESPETPVGDREASPEPATAGSSSGGAGSGPISWLRRRDESSDR